MISIIVTCFPLFPQLEKLQNTFQITARDNPETTFTDDLLIYTLELEDTKLAQLPALNEPLRKWLEFFHYSDKKSEAEMNMLLQNSDPAVRQAYDAYVRFGHDEELRMLEDARQQYLHDYTSDMEYATRKGRAEGHTVGTIAAIFRTLTKRFRAIPESLETRIFAITDLERLEKLADFAYDCQTLAEFAESIK